MTSTNTTGTESAGMTWTEVGQQLFDAARAHREGHNYAKDREAVSAAIAELTWRRFQDVTELPFNPGLGIQQLIKEVPLPRVSRIAWNASVDVRDDVEGSRSEYSLYGIEANFTHGRVRVYAVDRGVDLLIVAHEDVSAAEAAAADAPSGKRADVPARPGVVWADGWRQQLPGCWPYAPDQPHKHHQGGHWTRDGAQLLASCCGLDAT